MTTDYSDPQLSYPNAHSTQPHLSHRQGTAGLVTAGAMTALLSGDLRLAVRATRLLIGDNKQNPAATPKRAARLRRVWRRPS
jgi:hypothetical protein